MKIIETAEAEYRAGTLGTRLPAGEVELDVAQADQGDGVLRFYELRRRPSGNVSVRRVIMPMAADISDIALTIAGFELARRGR